MPSNCNIAPQIKVGDTFEDSKLFMELWDRAKQLYPNDATKARNKAKRDYAYYRSPQYLYKHGNWVLFHKLNNNTATNEDLATFRSLYGSNMEKLSKSITIELNSQNEPVLKREDVSNTEKAAISLVPDEYIFATPGEYTYVNEAFSALFIRNKEYLTKGFTRHSEETIRDRFIILLRSIAEANTTEKDSFMSYTAKYNAILDSAEGRDLSPEEEEILDYYNKTIDNLNALADEIENGDPKGLWASFIHYYKAEFGGTIRDNEVEDYEETLAEALSDDDIESYAGDDIVKNWDSRKQFKEDRKKTVSIVFKRFLLSMIFNQDSITYDFNVDNGKVLHNVKMDEFENKYGIKRPIDINRLWNQLIVLTADVTEIGDLVNKLTILSDSVYNGVLKPLIDKLTVFPGEDNNPEIKDKNAKARQFFNAYCNSVRLAMTPVAKSVITSYSTDEGQGVSYRTEQANRECFARNSIYNSFRTAISTAARSSSDIFKNIKNYSTINVNASLLVRDALRFANSISAFMDLATFASYVSISNKIDYNTVYRYYLSDDSDSVNISTEDRDVLNTKVNQFMKLLKDIATTVLKDEESTSSIITALDPKNKVEKEDAEIQEAADNLKNYINQLSVIGSFQPGYKINLMFTNAKGETEYTPEFFNSLSNRFQGIVSDSGEIRVALAKDRFKDFLTAVNLKDNPVLWNINGSGGLFNPKYNNGKIVRKDNGVPELDSVNTVAFRNFTFERFSGLSNSDTGIGLDYVGMHGLVWTTDMFIRQMQGLFSLPSGDASRCYQFNMPCISEQDENSGLYGIQSIPLIAYSPYHNIFIDPTSESFANNSDDNVRSFANEVYKTIYNSKMFKLFMAGTMQEIDNMRYIMKMLYKVEDDRLKVKDEFLTNDGSLNYELLHGLSFPIFWDGKNLLDENGVPTGNIFKFFNYNHRITDDKTGKVTVKTFLDFLGYEQPMSFYNDLAKDIEMTKDTDDFILTELGYGKAFVKMFISTLNNRVKEGRSKFDPVRKFITSTKTYTDTANRMMTSSANSKNYELNEDQIWDMMLANQFTMYSIYSIAYQDLFVGSSYEFKNALDWAKRVSQASRIGAVTLSTQKYTQVVVNDAFVTSNMLGLLRSAKFKDGKGFSDTDIQKLINRYGIDDKGKAKLIESTNAFNIITEKEALRRFKEKGDFDRYNPDGSMSTKNEMINTINRLIEGKAPVTKEEYMAVVQQLKYYYFDRTSNYEEQPIIPNMVSSHQDKNSTIILFKHMYAGTEYEKLANWMEQEHIDSISFVSGTKVSTRPVLEIFGKSEDPSKTVLNITKDASGKYVLIDGPADLTHYKHELKYSSLYTQQTIPSHLKDETNKIGTQLAKKIFDNLDFNGDYINPSDKSKTLKGKTKSNTWTDTDDSAGLFNRYHMMLAAKASDNTYSLLRSWGCIDDNGNIIYKEGTDLVKVDIDRMIKDIRDYFNDTSISQNILNSVKYINGNTFLPLWHPTIKSKIESVLLARIDNKINRLKIKGAHCTIQPDNLIVPSRKPDAAFGKEDLIEGSGQAIKELVDKGNVKFSKEFWASRCEVDENGDPIMRNGEYVMKKVKVYDKNGKPVIKDNDYLMTDASFELRSEYYDENGIFHPAEMILNAWDSRLPIDDKGYLELDKVPDELKTMFGIRIPTEGMQSMFVVKVVGVINNGASQAILPRHIMERTGHDFDIDSIYLYIKDFEIIGSGSDRRYIPFEVEGPNAKRQAIDYLARLYFEDELNKLRDDYYAKRNKENEKLVELYDRIDGIRNNPAVKAYIKAKNTLDNYLNNVDPNNTTLAQRDELIKLQTKLDEAAMVFMETFNTNSVHSAFKRYKIGKQEIEKFDKQVNAIKDKKEQLKADYAAAIEKFKNEVVLNKYNSLDVYHRSAMQAKDNYIIDTWISIHTDLKTFMNREKSNTYEESVNMSDYINNVGGYNSKYFNQHFILDALVMRNTINDISVLKGIAISASQTMGVMAQTGIRFSDSLAIPIKITPNEMGISDEYNREKVNMGITKLKNLGYEESSNSKDKTKDFYMDSEGFIVKCKTPFNNPKGTWVDVLGDYISEQATELPAHILDAAKYFMGFNVNTTTAPIMALLTSFPITHVVNLKSGDLKVEGANRFAYANLVIHQQVIVDFVNELAVNQLNNKYTFSNVAFANVREHYAYDLINAIAYKMNSEFNKGFTKAIEEFNKDDNGNAIYTDTDLKMLNDIRVANMNRDADVNLNDFRKAYKKSRSYYTYRQVEVALKFITSLKNYKGITYNYYNTPIDNAQSIETLDKNFKKGVEYNRNIDNLDNYIDYLSDQLKVLDYYIAIDKTAQVLRMAQSTLTAEKKGAGPDMTVSDKFLDSIIKLNFNFDELMNEAKAKGISQESIDRVIKDYYVSSDVRAKSDTLVKAIESFNAEIDVINSNKSQADQIKHISPKESPLETEDGIPAMQAVYPFLFDDKFDVKDSVYPLMAQQLKSVNLLATKLFSDIFITENPRFKANVNYILYKLGRPNDIVLRDKVINYAINSSTANLEFFRGIESDKDYTESEISARIAGIVGATPIRYEVANGVMQAKFDASSDLNAKYAGVPIAKFASDPICAKETHERKVKIFKTLSVATRVSMIKASIGKDIFNDFDHILNILDPGTNARSILRRGYMSIPLSRYSDNESRTIDSFLEMVNSSDDYIRSTAEDLVRYAYYVYGFKFGKNYARYIFSGLLGYSIVTDSTGNLVNSTALKTRWGKDFDNIDFTQLDGTTDEEMRNIIGDGYTEFRSFDLSMAQYANNLRDINNNVLMADDLSKLDAFLENFIKANADSSKVVHRMAKKRTTRTVDSKSQEITFINCNLDVLANYIATAKGLKDVSGWNKFAEKYEKLAEKVTDILSKYDNGKGDLSAKKHMTGRDVLNQLIIVPRSWIESSEFAKDNYLVSKTKLLNDVNVQVSKIARNSFKVEGKLYKAVRTKDFVYYAPINRTLPTEYGNTVVPVYEFGVENFALYEALISEIDPIISSSENANVTNVVHNSISLTIEEVTSNADETLYIGSNDGFNSAFIKSDSTTKASIEDVLGLEFDKGEPLRKIKKLALIGGNETLSIDERINISRRFSNVLNSFIQSHNVEQVDVVQNGDVSDLIADALRTNNGVKTNIHTVKETVHYAISLTEYNDGSNDGNTVSAIETLKVLNQTEKTAIANISIVAKQFELIGKLDEDIIEASKKEKEIQSLVPEDFKNIANYLKVLDYNINNLQIIISRLQDIAIDARPSTIGALFDEDKIKDRNKFLTDLNIVDTLIASQSYISNIKLFDVDDFKDDPQLALYINEINEKIEKLKSYYAAIERYKDRVDDASVMYFAMMLIKNSKNPAITSEFNNLRKQLAEKGFSKVTIDALEVNPQTLAETIKVMLKDNIDISYVVKMLDSVAQMGVPLIDTALKSYEGIVLNARKFAIRHSDNLYELFKDFYGPSFGKSLSVDYSASRADEFKSKFIDERTHQLINPFNTSMADDLVRKYKAKKYDEYIKERRKVNEDVNKVNKEIDDLIVKLNDLKAEYKKTKDETRKKELNDEYIETQAELSIKDVDLEKYRQKLADLEKDINTAIRNADNIIYQNIAIDIPIKNIEVDGRQFPVVDFDNTDAIEAIMNSATAKIYGLTRRDIIYMLNMYDQSQRSSLKKRDQKINSIVSTTIRPNTNFMQVVYELPVEDYIKGDSKFKRVIHNDKFNRLSDKEFDFLIKLQREISDATRDAIISVNRSTTFYPVFIKGSFLKALQTLVGYQEISQDDYINTVTGGVQYYLKAKAMNKPKAINITAINYSEINDDAKYNSIIEKAREKAKVVGYNKPIDNFSDIMDLNSYIYDKREDFLDDAMTFDPIVVLKDYISQLAVVKTREDFRPTMQRLEALVGSDRFEARNLGRNYTHRGVRKNTGKREIVTKKGKETAIHQRFKGFWDIFEGKSKVNSHLDQIIKIFNTTNSRTLMWMNITAAIKNIGTGNVNIWAEAVGGEFITAKTILKAQGRYFSALLPLISSLGEYRIETDGDNYTEAQLDAALIKLGGNIFEEGRELGNSEIDIVTNILSKWDNIAYMPNSAGEHYLQFTTYLAAMDTHRVVHGKIMNFEQFVYYLRDKVFSESMSADELKAYNEMKQAYEIEKGNNVIFRDHIEEFLTNPKYKVSRETKRKFADAYTKQRKEARRIFESEYATVRSQFTMKNGLATIKEDSDLTITEFAGFLNKVKNVNHSLHGIYNTFDQSELSQRIYGEMMLQFRKWLRPSFIRYFGKRLGKVIFDEGLEAYRSGAYIDFGKFVFYNAYKGWQRSLSDGRETNQNEVVTYTKAVMNFFKGLMFFMQDMSLRWKIMPEFQRMNMRRAMANGMSLALLTLAAGILMATDWDDDDESEAATIMMALIANTVYGMHTELLETGFTGMYLFYKRTSEAPIPFETTLNNAIQMLYYGIVGNIFLDSDDMIVSSGIYRGQNKVWVNFRKIIPAARSYFRLIELPDNTTYYAKNNPLLQIINKFVND